MSTRLPHYLRTYRKRAGFTQDEMAFLFGCKSSAKILKYERFRRQPNLSTIFSYQTIFDTPPHVLFAGVFQKAGLRTHKRAQLLFKKLSREKLTPLVARKLDALKSVASGPTEVTLKPHE